MKTFIINKNDSEKRLDSFLTKSVPLLPKSLMHKYIREKKIKLNGKRASHNVKLYEGDVLELYVKDEFFTRDNNKYDFLKSSKDLDVVYEDKNIILINKPLGLLSHSDKKERFDTAITRILHYLYEKGEYDPEKENSFSPALANRIDRNTTGIVIAAKNAETLRALNELIKNREIRRFYLCVCIGKFNENSGLLTGFLKKVESTNTVIITDKKLSGSKKVETAYKVIHYNNGVSLIEAELITGRPHQLRAHFAFINHPILGDVKYIKNKYDETHKKHKSQLLCSYKLIFELKADAGILNYLNGKTFEIEDIWFKSKFNCL